MNCSVLSLFSGSRGNAYLYRCRDTQILIDCGVSAKALKDALCAVGSSVEQIDAIFITHEHIDHVRALRVLLKKHRIPIHIVSAAAESLAADGTELTPDFVIHPPLYRETVGSFEVRSFPVPHDSACCIGFRIEAHGACGECRRFYHATDTGCITDEMREALQGADAAVMEANHDENLLLIGRYPYPVKQRILSERGHLSNEMCASLAVEAARGGTRHILLAHLSAENNYPALAKNTVVGALDEAGLSCRVGLAQPDSPVILYSESPEKEIFQ